MKSPTFSVFILLLLWLCILLLSHSLHLLCGQLYQFFFCRVSHCTSDKDPISLGVSGEVLLRLRVYQGFIGGDLRLPWGSFRMQRYLRIIVQVLLMHSKICMAFISVRPIWNESFILKYLFISQELDFLLLTESVSPTHILGHRGG